MISRPRIHTRLIRSFTISPLTLRFPTILTRIRTKTPTALALTILRPTLDAMPDSFARRFRRQYLAPAFEHEWDGVRVGWLIDVWIRCSVNGHVGRRTLGVCKRRRDRSWESLCYCGDRAGRGCARLWLLLSVTVDTVCALPRTCAEVCCWSIALLS